jgi:hypothetical protein
MSRPTSHHDDPYQYGSGIFDSIGNWLKKSKLVSTLGSIIAPVAGVVHPALGAAVTAGTALAKQKGFGVRIAGEGRPPKSLTKNQVKCLMEGRGRLKMLKSGAVSLAALKKKYKDQPKNISPAQWRALLSGKAKWGKGQSIDFSVGTLRRTAPQGRRLAGPQAKGLVGKGVTLAGKGTKKGQKRSTKGKRKAYEPYIPFDGEGVSLPGRGKRAATKKKYSGY